MKSQIETVFPQCIENTCLEAMNHSKFWINDPNDDQTKCELTIEENPNNHFEIENPTEKEIYFLAIDKCIFQDSDEHQKCDFAVFDNNCFCWVEIKTGKLRSRRKDRKTAIEQLRTTIGIFKEQLSFEDLNLEATICFYSTQKTYPQSNAQNLAERKRFLDEFQTRLMEGNKKVF